MAEEKRQGWRRSFLGSVKLHGQQTLSTFRLLDRLFNFSETKVVRDVISILCLYQGRWLAPSLNTTRDALPH